MPATPPELFRTTSADDPPAGSEVASSLIAAGKPTIGIGSILSAFRLTMGASLLTILLGLASNKVVAILAGTTGIGVLGLYRSLTTTASVILAPSVSTLVVQRVSTAETPDEARGVLRAAWLLFLLQLAALALVALFGAEAISSLVFGAEGQAYTTEVRVVLLLVSGVLALRLVTALLNGRVRVRASMGINLLSSALTLAAVYPLLLLGDIGLAMVIGLTCGLAAMVGVVYVWREYGLSRSDFSVSREQWRALRSIPLSPSLIIHMIGMSLVMFALQFMINREYGSVQLGLYASAAMMETSLMQVLSSAMFPYYMPSLAKVTTQEGKAWLINRMLCLVLCVSIPAALFLISFGETLITVLFSAEFERAASLLPAFVLAVQAQCVVWCYAVYLQHKSAYLDYVLLDGIWAAVLLLGIGLAVTQALTLGQLVWAYTGSYCVSAVLYVAHSRIRYGGQAIDPRLGALLLLLAVCAAAFLVYDQLLILQVGFGLAAIATFIVYFRLPSTPPIGAGLDARPASGV